MQALPLAERDLGRWIGRLPRAEPLLIYCYHGYASQVFARTFAEFGHTEVYSIDGGFAALAQAVEPARHVLPAREDVMAHSREIVTQAFAALDKRLPDYGYTDYGYAVGERFTVADATLFYNAFWADRTDIPLPPRVAAHYRRLRALPVVRQVLAEEGYRS